MKLLPPDIRKHMVLSQAELISLKFNYPCKVLTIGAKYTLTTRKGVTTFKTLKALEEALIQLHLTFSSLDRSKSV